MANVQLDGGYCKIANPIIEALARTRIPGEARQVFDAIIRKTYGWNKKEDRITNLELAEMTGLQRSRVNDCIQRLLKMNLIIATKKGCKVRIYRINKDIDTWVLHPKKGLHPNRGTLAPKDGGTIAPILGAHKRHKDTLQKTYIAVFEFWNSKEIVKHRLISDKIKSRINGLLKDGFTQEEIIEAIKNYSEIFSCDDYYFNYRWGLEEFLSRGVKKFITAATPFDNFLKDGKKKEADQLQSLFGAPRA